MNLISSLWNPLLDLIQDALKHCHKIHIVSVNHLGDEFDKLPLESLVRFDPGCTEVESERSSVASKMPFKIMSQHASKLVWINNVGTRGNQMTSRKGFVKSRVVTTIQLVYHHLPHWVRP